MKFRVVFQCDEDGVFVTEVPSLPGCISQGPTRDEALRNQLLTDAHSPGMFRAFVPLPNIDAFYAAFNLQPGDKLYRAPADRVKIW